MTTGSKAGGGKLNGPENDLFSGEYWTGSRGLELGLVDEIGDVVDVVRGFGDGLALLGAAHNLDGLEHLRGRLAHRDEVGIFRVDIREGGEHPECDLKVVRVDLGTGRATVFWRAPRQHDLVGVAIGPDGDLYATLLVSGQVVRLGL